MDFRHLIVTCLFSKLRLPFDNQKVKENYAIFLKNSGHVYVEAGYWYQLKATVNVTSDLVDCDIVCYTNDWIFDDSTFNDVPMSPVN